MKLSIITINLNNAEGLRKTIESVVTQTFTDYEYIIIDGGSTDESVEVIKQYADKITYWVSEPDKGIYNAMNKGILKANGEYLLFLNSGDIFFSKKSVKNLIEHSENYDIVYGNIWVINKDEGFVKQYPDELTFGYFIYDTLPHPASLIKKNLFENNLYNEELKIVSDWVFFMVSICKNNYSYKHVNEIISIFYYDGLSSQEVNRDITSKEKKECLSENFKLFLKEYEELNQLRQYKSRINNIKIIKLIKKIRNFIKP